LFDAAVQVPIHQSVQGCSDRTAWWALGWFRQPCWSTALCNTQPIVVVSFTSGCRFIGLPNVHQTDESRFSHQSVWECSGSTALWALWILLIWSILFQCTSVSMFYLPDGTPRHLDKRLSQFLSNRLVTCNLMQKLESHFINQFMDALAALHDGNFGFFRFEAFLFSVLPYRSFIRYMAHATASSLTALKQCWFNWLVHNSNIEIMTHTKFASSTFDSSDLNLFITLRAVGIIVLYRAYFHPCRGLVCFSQVRDALTAL